MPKLFLIAMESIFHTNPTHLQGCSQIDPTASVGMKKGLTLNQRKSLSVLEYQRGGIEPPLPCGNWILNLVKTIEFQLEK